MTLLLSYLLGGLTSALLLHLAAKHLHQHAQLAFPPTLRNVLIWMLCWPLALSLIWALRQHLIWRKPTPHPVLWLHDIERPGQYHLIGRRPLRVPWRHRRVKVLSARLIILLRPRPTIEAPLLLGKGRLILTPLLFQIQLCWGKTSRVPLNDLLGH